MNAKAQKIIKSILTMILILSALATSWFFFNIYRVLNHYDKVFAHHVSIENQSIGGLTLEQAKEKLLAYNQGKINQMQVVLTHEETSKIIAVSDFNPISNLDEVLALAYQEGHNQNFLVRYRLATGQGEMMPTKNFDLSYTFLEDAIVKGLEAHTLAFHQEAINATIQRIDRQFVITPDQPQEQLNTLETAKKLHPLLENHLSTTIAVAPIISYIPAPITSYSLESIQTPIASFHTPFNSLDPDRNANLALASKKINRVLSPGEVFSLGEQIEPITSAAGYKYSKVIVNGKLEEGIGGGVCQIASTLYNAVLLSKLDITLRANHSLPVAYVPLGRDATYASGNIDFQFQNNTDYPVFIESYCEDNHVYVNLFSHPDVKEGYDEIKFLSETVEELPPPDPKVIKDPELKEGEQVQESIATPGKVVKLYKIGYRDGEVVHKELVNTSTYRAKGDVLRIGTGGENSDTKIMK